MIVVHVALLVHEAYVMAPTVDEPAHVAAGVSHWDRGTFELYRPNPPLARMLATLPVVAGSPSVDYSHVSPVARSEWFVGHDYIDANGGARFLRDLRRGRLVGIAWSVLGAILVALWARELWGERAACLAVTLWCFEPTILGHAALVTPDVASTVAGFGATYVFWHYVRRPSWSRCGAVGLVLGIAQLTKFTQLALYGVWPVLWWLYHRGSPPVQPRARSVGQALAIAATSLLVINAGYGFRGALPRLGSIKFHSATFAGELPLPPPTPSVIALPVRPDGTIETPASPARPLAEAPWATGNRFADTWLAGVRLPVPDDYVRGIDAQQADFEGSLPSYLRGELRDHGWWYYYLYAGAVKVPLGLLLLGGWALVVAIRGRSRSTLFLALPAVTFLTMVSAKTGFNHHFRYVLPMFPFAIVMIARLGMLVTAATARRAALVVGATAATVASSLAVYPHCLSYFNELAGGPEHGDEHLVDSNLDWGQDLLALRSWLRLHQPTDPLGLAYFGGMDPRTAGIRYAPPPPVYARSHAFVFRRELEAPMISDEQAGPQPGFYAVSVNYLRGVRYPIPDGAGHWQGVLFDDFIYFRELEPFDVVGTTIRLYCIDRETADAMRARLGLSPTTRADPACRGIEHE